MGRLWLSPLEMFCFTLKQGKTEDGIWHLLFYILFYIGYCMYALLTINQAIAQLVDKLILPLSTSIRWPLAPFGVAGRFVVLSQCNSICKFDRGPWTLQCCFGFLVILGREGRLKVSAINVTHILTL